MSQIETNVLPLMSAMIRGQSLDLTLSDRLEIGKWLGLKAIVERYSRSPIDPVSQEWRTYFYEHHEPPNSWYGWIARYDGSYPVFIGAGSVTSLMSNLLSPFFFRSRGFTMTLAVGYFFAQIFGFTAKGSVQVDPTRRIAVWPHPLLAPGKSLEMDSVSWPPSNDVTDDILIETTQMGDLSKG